MHIVKAVVTNGFIYLIPIFMWNMVFASKLPVAFAPENFDTDIPKLILVGENVFRAIIFILPLLFVIDVNTQMGKLGLIIYILGCLVYFVSWVILIYAPNAAWSNGLFGFVAPAFTPIIWLIGIGLMTTSYNLDIPFARWHYLIPCVIFIGIHVSHTVFAFYKVNR